MLDKGELVAVVSMDLSKAFDVIDHDLLLAKLKACGVGEKFCALQGLLVGETAQVKIEDTFSNWKGVIRRGLSWGQCFLIFSSTTCFTG